MGAAAVAPLVLLGDRLGLYKALDQHGPMSTEDLAIRTGTTERYVREWCSAQAGEKKLGNVARDGGFRHFRRAAETPFNLILEARP